MTPLFWLRWIVRGVLALVLLVVLVVGWVAGRVWWVARADERPRSDTILVLGASQYDGRPSQVFRSRLQHAKDLYDAGVAPRIVTVGGKAPGDRFTEAESGAAWLGQQGVPRSALVVVPQGRTTLESLRAARSVYSTRGWHTAVIVTDPWHELRSRKMAGDLGIDAATSPTRNTPAVRTRGEELRYIGRETAGYLYYALLHRDTGHAAPAAAPAAPAA